MKKIVFPPCMLTVVMTGCKKTEKTEKKSAACIDLREYIALSDVTAQAKWLRDNGKNVCPNILEACILKEHLLDASVSIEPVNGKSLKMSWIDIKTLTSGIVYEKYVGFDIDPATKDIKGLTLVPMFDSSRVCYSAPLFNAIAKNENLTDSSSIEFINARIGGGYTKIIIKAGAHVYDYSEQPPLDGHGIFVSTTI